MRQRHPRPPAVRTERTGRVDADEFVEFEGHGDILLEPHPSDKTRHCEERSDEAIHTFLADLWIASLRSQ
jgi:hypothetical protein